MPIITLKEILKDARDKKYAVGMFNVVNLEMLRAILGAAEEEKSPVIIGLAEVHLPYCPFDMMAPAMVKAAKEAKVPVAVHLDHGMSFDSIVKAMHLGFTSVMFDGSILPYEDNIKKTKEIVKLAKILGTSVEAELGHVGGSESGGEDLGEAMYTDVDQAVDFVGKTGVDALAVAVGTVHGVYRSKPKLDIVRLSEINSSAGIPLVLHGGSGLSDDDFRNCIENGVGKINIFTDMTIAAVNCLRDGLEQKTGYLDLINKTVKSIQDDVVKKMWLFGSSGRA